MWLACRHSKRFLSYNFSKLSEQVHYCFQIDNRTKKRELKAISFTSKQFEKLENSLNLSKREIYVLDRTRPSTRQDDKLLR